MALLRRKAGRRLGGQSGCCFALAALVLIGCKATMQESGNLPIGAMPHRVIGQPYPEDKAAASALSGLALGALIGAAAGTVRPTAAGTAASGVPAFERVEVYFATDRRVAARAPDVARHFTNDRGTLVHGSAHVTIPATHRIGEIERPKWYRLERTPVPHKHVVLEGATLYTPDGFYRRVNLKPRPDTAFVFVHGYNVSFEDAALRTAQMAVDLELAAVPVFYSWPSQGGMSSYPTDEANIEWSHANLRQFLEQFAQRAQVKEVVVVAHSMGSRAASQALIGLLDAQPALRPKFRELVLAAPDIDAAVFKRDIAPLLNARLRGVTLYASSRDKALYASRKLHGHPRAGESGEDLVVIPGMETIDATLVDTDFLGHSYAVQTRTILTDLTLLLKKQMRAGDRPTLREVGDAAARHWAFRP
jgi:esterase/lipase superfamily enzyme